MFNKFMVCCSLVLGVFTYSQAQAANPFSISESEVNHYLAEKLNVEDKLGLPGLFSMDYKVENLQAKIGENNSGRVELTGTIDSSLNLSNKIYAGKLNLTFDTIPYYNAEKGEVYLKDLRILRWSGSPDNYAAQLQSVMPFLSDSIGALLSSMPIYTLDDSKVRDALIKKFAKGITVEPGKLSVDAGML
ncbi:DUF1439 domain-containing protein [Lonepinella sp. BR2474]|uniref:DUF1439 domain-containing protein n=1 Tax=Lonepinella sp. BR2474 TaxID=3434548 RepID=UPI003F6DAC95